MSEELIEKTKTILCAPHLELVCTCAGCGNCGGCKVIRLAREWTKTFGKRECPHLDTWEPFRNGVKKCVECGAIV